jgi:hypothetical protein
MVYDARTEIDSSYFFLRKHDFLSVTEVHVPA